MESEVFFAVPVVQWRRKADFDFILFDSSQGLCPKGRAKLLKTG